MKNKKLISMLLATSMMVATFTGCGNNDAPVTTTTESKPAVTTESVSTDNTTGEFDPKSITEGVTLTVAMPESTRVADFNTNSTTLAVEEALGVNLEFITFPAADYEQKINVMVMGGDKLPDIIFVGNSTKADWSGWVAEEVLLPLDEYYADPNMSANITAQSELIGVDMGTALSMADGHVYYLPKLAGAPHNAVYSKVWIYEPWLKTLGKEVPTTTEDFYELCQAVIESDLNGNGKKDELAMSGKALSNWFPCLMNGFVYSHDSEYRIVEDGKINFAYVTDEWKEGLKYLKKFFDEGLIPQEAITQSSTQFDSQLYADEQTIFSFAGWVPEATKGKEWRNEWIPLLPLIGPEGEQNAMFRTTSTYPAIGAAITVDCENPEAAFLVCDYLCSEEFGITARYGKQGKDWDYWEDAQESLMSSPKEDYIAYDGSNDIYFIAYDDVSFWNNPEPQNDSYIQQGCYIAGGHITNGMAVKGKNLSEEETLDLEYTVELNAIIKELYNYSPEQIVDTAPLTSEESASIADAKATLKDYVSESIGAFLTGSWDIDEKWDDYLAELEKIGYKDVLATYQIGYDRTH